MKIALIVPNRNNLKYFKWMYDSVRKNQGDHIVWICSAADACTDGTEEYYKELKEQDPYFKYIVNPGPHRLGHTILYDQIIDELAAPEVEIAMIWHCDMYLCPGALDAIDQLMFKDKAPMYKRIVSLTRIEPPLHLDGPEKLLANFGIEPEEFNEQGLLNMLSDLKKPTNQYSQKIPENKQTSGIFAPWAFFIEDFKEIGGHDKLYRPQSKEDSIMGNQNLYIEENGIFDIKTIEELFNSYQEFLEIRQDGKEVINTKKLKLKTIVPKKNGAIGIGKIQGILRKKVLKSRLKTVQFKWGEVIVTDDHCLITQDLGAIKVSNLEGGHSPWHPTGKHNLSGFYYKEIDFNKIEAGISGYILPVIENITEYGEDINLHNICEFLGFFCGDGRVNGNDIKISEISYDLVTDIKNKSMSLFGQEVFTGYRKEESVDQEDVHVYRFSDKLVAQWLARLLGDSSGSKKVPTFIFNLPKVYQISFLYGYLKADGWLGTSVVHCVNEKTVRMPDESIFSKSIFDKLIWKSETTSSKLASGIYYLLFKCFNCNNRVYYRAEKNTYIISKLKTSYRGLDDYRVIPYSTENSEVYVYDLEVRDTNTFIGGVGFVGLHNSDIFNRFLLNGVQFIQTWEGFVYHMTCRGSRFNPMLTTPGKNSSEWELQNKKSTRNFIRKWGHFIKHTKYMLPVVPPKYDTGLIIVNCTLNLLRELEPWADRVYVDSSIDLLNQYIQDEQPNTEYDLSDKIKPFQQEYHHGVLIIIDGATFTNNDMEYLSELSTILQRSGSVGEFKLGNINLVIKSLKSYENDLIYL